MSVLANTHTAPTDIKVTRPQSGDELEVLLGVVRWGAVVVCLIAFTAGAIMLGMEFLGRADKNRSARWMVGSGAFGAFLIGLGPVTLETMIDNNIEYEAAVAAVPCGSLPIPVQVTTCVPPPSPRGQLAVPTTTPYVPEPLSPVFNLLSNGTEGQYYVIFCDAQDWACLDGPYYFPADATEIGSPFEIGGVGGTRFPPEYSDLGVWTCEENDCTLECDEDLNCTYTCAEIGDCAWFLVHFEAYEDETPSTAGACSTTCETATVSAAIRPAAAQRGFST